MDFRLLNKIQLCEKNVRGTLQWQNDNESWPSLKGQWCNMFNVCRLNVRQLLVNCLKSVNTDKNIVSGSANSMRLEAGLPFCGNNDLF